MSFLFDDEVCGDYCAACTYLGENSDSGKYYCSHKGAWVSACDPRCSSQVYAYSRSDEARKNMYEYSRNFGTGCYLTTIMCNILGYPDNNYYLNTLRNFRENIMKQNSKWISMLVIYDMIGPMISFQLSIDPHRKAIAETMFNNYITKAVMAIEKEKYQEAVTIYLAMTNALADRYGINMNVIAPSINEIDMNTIGRGRIKKPNKASH